MTIIRTIKLSDAAEIQKIYNYYILNSIATFDEHEKSIEEIEIKIKDVTKQYPWFIVEENDKIVAYAHASNWKDKSAYNQSVEGTIYIKHNYTSKGLGTKLYKHLIDNLKTNGYHSILGVISLPNDASISLHEKLGFEKVAHFKEIGKKFERQIDVGCWQLIL